MAYAQASDVTVRWAREASPEEIALINVRLDDAERMIKRRLRREGKDLETEIAEGNVDLEDVKQIEADAVLRLVRNPEGYLSETDGTYQYTVKQDLATGRLEIFPDEWEALGVSASKMTVLVPNVVMPT